MAQKDEIEKFQQFYINNEAHKVLTNKPTVTQFINKLTSLQNYGSGMDSASKSSNIRGKERPASKADNITAIYESIISKMWEPRCLTTLWASTYCFRDSFFTYNAHDNLLLTDCNELAGLLKADTI
jgi:hypothetical protein